MTKDTKAVIFDFDMTLADSSYAIHHCSNLLARKFGLEEVSREVVLAGIGLPIEDCWRLYWGDFKEEWLGYYRDEFRGVEQTGIRLFPNTVAALEELRAKGVKTGVVSNRRFARRVVDATKLTPYMDVIIGLEDVTNAKPDPEALFKAIDKLGVGADEAVYVGDTDIDMKTAVAAAVRGVGVTTGNFGEDGLAAAGAWRVCSDLIEVPGLFGLR
ncbi:HAD family hydrolase [Cloacibacillus evryensis]|uniref:HAD family hydrolase n=1 Tax=Cloacibacillus evryensis TaxID=508460 RepID=UPI0026714614|nr:HAD family hydrolase [Cloacibacillus evryensis]